MDSQMPLKLAKYGLREIVASAAILLPATILSWAYVPWLCPLFAVLLCWVLYFFRDPKRTVPEGEGIVVAPADGKVVEITDCEEGEYLNGPALKVGIFLSVLNVHINRAPYAGKVEYLRYHKGEFHNALFSGSSQFNENNCVGIETNGRWRTKMLVKQIAGAIARRVVCECQVGDALAAGEKFGMIKFGSRTELYVPKDVAFELQVVIGQKVAAGKTVLGRFK